MYFASLWWRGPVGRLIGRVAVELDVMETNFTVISALLVVVAEVNINLYSTAALGVLDSGSVLLARSNVLADRLVRHLVVEFDIAVEFNGNLNLLDTESVLPLLAIEGCWLIFANFVCDTLGVERALGERVTLAELVLTAPTASEVEVAVSSEATFGKIAPIEAACL